MAATSIGEMVVTSYGGFDPGMNRMPTFVVHHYTRSPKRGRAYGVEWKAIQAAGGTPEQVAAARADDERRIAEYIAVRGRFNEEYFSFHPFSNLGS